MAELSQKSVLEILQGRLSDEGVAQVLETAWSDLEEFAKASGLSRAHHSCCMVASVSS